jgi:glycosyltransferase involved in cell wall biosynthesis
VDGIVNKCVLMIAYHYPPVLGSSGIQRTLKFSQYLPAHGWEPLVLTVNPRAYAETDDGQLREIPPQQIVRRAFALDTARHLALHGAYPRALALPDRWSSWWLGGVFDGLRLIHRYRPKVIWSTYPIATAHLIGLTLARLSGLPWVADFRDSMTEPDYPRDPLTRRAYLWIERRTVARCARAVFTTPGAVRMYRERYPATPAERWRLIENGYDEENFLNAERQTGSSRDDGRVVLVHSGVLYPSERDPRSFFEALARLKREGVVSARDLRIVLRATGYDDEYRALLRAQSLDDVVKLEPPISYERALAEMLDADGLLVFQATNCNHQIPAKLYEYLRARRPILALTDPQGDTAAVLRAAGIDTIYRLDSVADIVRGMRVFLERLRAGDAPVASSTAVGACTRRSRTRELAAILDSLD